MSTVLSIMDRPDWDARTDNIVVADPDERTLLWVPRDLWCERFGKRLNRVFADEQHEGLMQALADLGIDVEHSLSIRRDALERALDGVVVTVQVAERLEFWYPLHPIRPIEEGRIRIAFEPTQERLAGERIHQWLGARYTAAGPDRPLLDAYDHARMRRQQVLVRSLLEDGFEFASVLADGELVSASGPGAIEELSRVDQRWRFSLMEDVHEAVRDGQMVLERTGWPRGTPAISVVVCSYRSRHRIDHALGSLRGQDLDEPWETIVVDSGDDDAADYVEASYPEVRVIRSAQRLNPAAARNAGVRVARGRFVAFLPDDGIAEPDWLRLRLRRHREGHPAVCGAITNGTPHHPVGTASYYTEYTALLPSERILREQEIPHCLSYERELLERLGGFPERLVTGEDTALNARIVKEGTKVGFDPKIRLAHVNLTSLRAYLRHLYEHGYGFGLAGGSYGSPSDWLRRSGWLRAAARILVGYPAGRWWAALRRVTVGRPRSLPAYLVLTPLIWAGFWSAAFGCWAGLRAGAALADPVPILPRESRAWQRRREPS